MRDLSIVVEFIEDETLFYQLPLVFEAWFCSFFVEAFGFVLTSRVKKYINLCTFQKLDFGVF